MINEELIFVDLDIADQTGVFEFLAKTIVEKQFANDEAAVYAALEKRESEGTTGMMDGFAIPHAKSEKIIKPAIIVIKLRKGIEWDSMDGQPTRYVLAMFIPTAESGSTHLKILSQVARMLMKSEFKDAFIATDSVSELAGLLSEKLEG